MYRDLIIILISLFTLVIMPSAWAIQNTVANTSESSTPKNTDQRTTEIRLSTSSKTSFIHSNRDENRTQEIKKEATVLYTHLPIVIIDTNKTAIKYTSSIQANMGIISHTSLYTTWFYTLLRGKSNHSTDRANNYAGKISIKIRGKSSKDFCKKQYKIETQYNDGANRNVRLLGMPKENDWILYGPYTDKTLIRTKLAFDIWREMGRYAPRSRFVELLLSNPSYNPNCVGISHPTLIKTKHGGAPYTYEGLYLLIEKIKRDKNRVHLKKLITSNTQPNNITGGYILKLDKFDKNDLREKDYFVSNLGTEIIFVYPKPKKITQEQKTWIKNYFNAFENSLARPNLDDPIEGYRKYINTESFVDFFLIQEFFKNIDSFRHSTYFYKDRNEKINMGPIWDFNFSSGNIDYCNADDFSSSSPYGWYKDTNDCGISIPFWWSRLLTDPGFKQALVKRWHILRETVLSEKNIGLMIKNYVKILGPSTKRNFQRWHILGKYIWPNSIWPETHAEEISNLTQWMTSRVKWIDENLNKISP